MKARVASLEAENAQLKKSQTEILSDQELFSGVKAKISKLFEYTSGLHSLISGTTEKEYSGGKRILGHGLVVITEDYVEICSLIDSKKSSEMTRKLMTIFIPESIQKTMTMKQIEEAPDHGQKLKAIISFVAEKMQLPTKIVRHYISSKLNDVKKKEKKRTLNFKIYS